MSKQPDQTRMVNSNALEKKRQAALHNQQYELQRFLERQKENPIVTTDAPGGR